ncbi:type II secretion system F family protein [Desulfurobacterium sp.]|uniref:type II secretion system F family protein n=1 Tax=Desulfurobacterium sp. TaxID=2004706 RepID=UPI00261DC7F9|nr:type II secretion system F family protein [Desulfurobacterium sp.]
MKVFKYKAVTPSGEVIKAEKAAENKKEVLDYIYSRGLIPLEINEKKEKISFSSNFLRKISRRLIKRKLARKDVISFFQSLSILLNSGIPMDKALSICKEVTSNEAMKVIIEDLLTEIRAGASLSDALSKYGNVFSKFYVNMIKAGEAGGVLPLVLERIYEHMKRIEDFKEKVVSSLIYPSFLILTGLASIIILIVFVVPRFMAIFESMDIKPPILMRLLSSLGMFFEKYWIFILIIVISIVALIKWELKKPKGKMTLYKMLLKTPILSDIILKMENIKFTSNLGMLLLNGVPILRATSIIKEMFTNPFFYSEIDQLTKKLREGAKLSEILSGSEELWHPFVIGMCSVGEESGNLGEMLVKASEALERETEETLTRIVSFIEPVTILVMGLIVGSIVVSMIGAIFSVNEIVR